MTPRSPDLTQLDFYVLRFIKDVEFEPPFSATLPELRARTFASTEQVTHEIVKCWSDSGKKRTTDGMYAGLPTEATSNIFCLSKKN